MDVSPYTRIQPAPFAVLDKLPAMADIPRFHVRRGDDWTSVTWGQFGEQIRAVAAWLIERGVGPGDRCAVYSPNTVAWAAAALGIQAAGAVMVPVYPATTPEQLEYILAHAEVRVLFVGGAQPRRNVAESRGRLGSLAAVAAVDDETTGEPMAWADLVRSGRELDRASSAVDDRLAAIDLDSPGILLYTSGTSGNPKGVPLTHRNVGANGADWLRSNARVLEQGYRDLLWLPMSHIFGFGEMCFGNLLGWESWLATPADALELLPEVQPHVFMSVPAYWEKLARMALADAGTEGDARRSAIARLTGGQLRFCLSGGAGLQLDIKELFRDAGVLIIEGYGLTETSPTLTINRPDDYRFDTVGKPLPSVELRLDDDGEILARGPNVFSGYHNDAAATLAAFTEDGWFRTGDIGRFTEEGFLQIIDRKKDILVTAGGKNVPPANIEVRFADDPVIERCVVYGDARPYLVAAVWVHPQISAGERDDRVRERVVQVNQGLARFETIKKWWIADEPLSVEAGTLTASLKLRRKAVYERYRGRFEELYA